MDVQFFGDLYISHWVLDATGSTADNPALFRRVQPVLDAADHNIVNFEGAATTAFVPHETKTYLLKMPMTVAPLLRAAGISGVTLANNHSMDFGFQGLFDTTYALEQAGIPYTGAGVNRAAAHRPMVIASGDRAYCVLAFSKTLPQSFWATNTRPGTAASKPEQIAASVKACTAQGQRAIVSFHWGREGSTRSLAYQRTLAHQAIDAGAIAVLGHHPHVLQEMEIYRDRPILYSLGNFAFGTDPKPGSATGLAAGLSTAVDGSLTLTMTPLVVRNDVVRFLPRPLQEGEIDPIPEILPLKHPCTFIKPKRHWVCLFESPSP